MNILNKRGILKFLHWATAAIILYFFIVEPDLPNNGTTTMMTAELSTHAGMGFLLSIIVVIWTLVFVRGGLVGKPGPKLPEWAKKIHPIMHKGLHFSLPFMLITGLTVGLTAPFQVLGFGLVPLNVPFIGGAVLNDLANEIHELSFNILILLIVLHSVFHLWRHFLLRDNALRLILPKSTHKLL